MTKKILYLLHVLIAGWFASSCCDDPKILGKYALADTTLNVVPYKKGQEIKFKHSNGYEFKFTVSDRVSTWRKSNDDEVGFHSCDYYLYEDNVTSLSSSYPKLEIKFSLTAQDTTDHYIKPLSITIGKNNQTMIDYHRWQLLPSGYFNRILFYDTLRVNQKLYRKVFQSEVWNYYTDIDTANLVTIKSILYNKEFGLLQIKMSNQETYTINE